ncbi:MAG TPA: hypothetical protein VLX28_18690, partial [Thermoanaerobaculia bacterium]|nr:hypothetical protein [Thermoanaerobaculia bacterium]
FRPAAKAIDDVLFTAQGRLFISADGGGSVGSSYTVQVQKPSSSAKVRQAFLMAASVGFQNYVIPNGTDGIRLNTTGITWAKVIPSDISSWNHEADVTSIIKPVVDAAPAGRVSFTVTEGRSDLIDGVALAVVFDDPSQTQDSTVSLLFGAQNTFGDTFSVKLANPIQTTSPSARFTMGLGISYGAQSACAAGVQYSQIDVNGQRLTSSAGGEDDGSCDNGALITVGGLDDSTNDPANPLAGANGNPRADDELYSLLPFINSTTTQVNIATFNPSNDDNIFFAYFQISGSASISTGSCSPSATTLCIDDQPNDHRFRVEVSYSTVQAGGLSGNGQAIPLSSVGVNRGGLFWFFGADNPELLVKVLNGCSNNGHYWVFYSAGTNVGFTLKVTDTTTGLFFQSPNPDLHLAPPVADISTLPCS